MKVLETALQNPDPELRAMVAVALGNTRDPAAIPVLIQMYSDQEGSVRKNICSALVTLTHYQWCDGSGNVDKLQVRWHEWWQRHASQLPLYGTDQCPAFGASLPAVK